MCERTLVNASSPPADAPIPTTGNAVTNRSCRLWKATVNVAPPLQYSKKWAPDEWFALGAIMRGLIRLGIHFNRMRVPACGFRGDAYRDSKTGETHHAIRILLYAPGIGICNRHQSQI